MKKKIGLFLCFLYFLPININTRFKKKHTKSLDKLKTPEIKKEITAKKSSPKIKSLAQKEPSTLKYPVSKKVPKTEVKIPIQQAQTIALTKSEKKEITKTRTITIANAFGKKELDQKKAFIPVPMINFSLSANGTEIMKIENKKIVKNETKDLTLNDNVLEIVYEFDFGYGKRSEGKRKERFTINPDITNINLGFSWKDPYHAKINGATPLEKIEL